MFGTSDGRGAVLHKLLPQKKYNSGPILPGLQAAAKEGKGAAPSQGATERKHSTRYSTQ